jgi:hypothetical protein
MAFQVSPGVEVKEIDLTTIVPAVSTTATGFAGFFEYGPIGQRITVNNVNDLRRVFKDPSNLNADTWFTAANFLGYGGNLKIVRVVDENTSKNAGTLAGFLVKNEDDYETYASTDGIAPASLNSNNYVAKYAGGSTVDQTKLYGNSLKVSVSNRDEFGIRLINDNFTIPSGETGGFTLGNDVPGPEAADKTFFFQGISGGTGSAVANQDLLRVGSGNRTITGITNGVTNLDVTFGTGTGFSNGAHIASSVPQLLVLDTALPRANVHTDGSQRVRLLGGATLADGITVSYATITGVSLDSESLVKGISLGNTFAGFRGSTEIPSTSVMDIIGTISVGSTQSGQSGISSGFVRWRYADNFQTVLPDTSATAVAAGCSFDLVNIAVIDEDGFFTGTKETVLETFDGVSVAQNAKDDLGRSLFYPTIINETSQYVWWGDHVDDDEGQAGGADWGTNASSTITDGRYVRLNRNYYGSLQGGQSAKPAGNDFITNGYELFEDSETVDVSILLGGDNTDTQARSIVDILTSTDAPRDAKVQTANIVAYRRGENAGPNGGSEDYSTNNLNVSSSYAVLDSGWKYQFDRFNDVFRYVPLNGDIAGIAVRSDVATETWFSPAGFNRGQVRDIVKLALNPKQAQRDDLYINGINPVVSFPGQGTLLFGDKTLLSKPSAFDRINVRRLFIVLEKAIATAAKFSLFEFNDSFTRAQFKNLIEPFLLDVQSRRGLIDFKVVCDESNNTAEIIDRNEFVADIFIKPNRSINFITLNFIATRTGVNFDEIAGAV